MQRKRSYVEAMEAGSMYDLLETTNVLVEGAFNQNVNVNDTSSANSDNNNETRKSVIEKDMQRSSSIRDDVFTDVVDEEYRSKSTDTDIYDNNKRHSIKTEVKRNYGSENDVDEKPETVDYFSPRKLTENSDLHSDIGDNASRGISIVEELIDEVYNNCAEYMSNGETAVRKSGRFDFDFDDDTNHNRQLLINMNAQNDGNIQTEEQRSSDDLSPNDEITTLVNDFQNYDTYDERIYRDTNYDSDDMLEYDGEEHDRQNGTITDNSLQIPNIATSEKSSASNIIYEYTGRNSSRKLRRRPENGGFRARRMKRLIFKNGETNIPVRNIHGKMGKYMKDMVTTLIESRWRWLTLLFSIFHFILWLSFALMFYLAAYSNGDISENPPAIPCIENGRTFTGIFTFSVETQVSIGYGEKSPTEECPEVIFIMVMEVVVGYALLGGMVGIVYVKIVRPEKNLDGVGFSKHAVVCMRDGRMCLVVRVWDSQGKHIAGTSASAWIVKHAGPNSIPLTLTQPNPLIIWPTTLQHEIGESSPLYDISAKDLLDQRFEIVFSLTGSSQLTGQMTQSRTSYLPHDILWGHRFQEVIRYNEEKLTYEVHRKLLNKTQTINTPLCSARLLHQLAEQGPSSPIFTSPPSSPLSNVTSPGWSFRTQYRPRVFNRSISTKN